MIKDFFAGRAIKSSTGLLVVTLLVGGISAQATGILNSPSGGYLVCVNSKTKVVTHPGSSSCPKGSKKIVLGAQGAAGANGLTGAVGLPGKDGADGKDGKTLWNGVKDPESTWGAPGDMFINSVTKTLFGPKNLDGSWPAGVSMVGPAGATGLTGATGVAGPSGPQGPGGSGPAGATGPAGPAGPSGIAITQLSICGASGTSLCKVGVQGPGGGTIFFVDYYDQYAGFNYLEAAPKSCENEIGGLPALKFWSSVGFVSEDNNWAGRAVGAGRANTTAIKAAFADDTGDNNAAHFATSCSAGSKSDWFLGSLGEMKLMYDNLQGVGEFSPSLYWSSTEASNTTAWLQDFYYGGQDAMAKNVTHWVRPVRAF